MDKSYKQNTNNKLKDKYTQTLTKANNLLSHINLREDICRLVSRPSESMGKDVSSITILNTVVVQTTGVVLSASCCICSHIKVGRCDGHFGTFHDWIIIMQSVRVDTDTPTT